MGLAMYHQIEERIVHGAERPITFEEFLSLNVLNDMDLIQGVMIQKMAAQLEHETLFAWLFWLLYGYVRQKKLGYVGGSRTAVEINEFHGRLPDLLYVRQERENIIRQKAIYGAPDLVVELISPNDRPTDISGLEVDYRNIGVEEMVFVDQQKRHVLILHKRENGYNRTELTSGELALKTVPGFVLQIEWLFADPRPDELNLLNTLLNA